MDEEADFDVGATFRRPIDDADYRLSAHFGKGTDAVAGGSRSFDSTAVGAVGEAVYGSTTLALGLGYESLRSAGPDADRCYVSAGIRGKTGVIGWSLKGHYRRIEHQDEVVGSAALGARYDIARGLSADLGLNHAKARADAEGIRAIDIRDTNAVLSLRYSFQVLYLQDDRVSLSAAPVPARRSSGVASARPMPS